MRRSERYDQTHDAVDLGKIDQTTSNLDRQKLIFENFSRLLEREKKRFIKLKQHFDQELLNQSPLEAEVKTLVRDHLKSLHLKKGSELAAQIRAAGQRKKAGQESDLRYDTEFYRIGMTPEERKYLVEQLLTNEKVTGFLTQMLEIPDRVRDMPDFDVEH